MLDRQIQPKYGSIENFEITPINSVKLINNIPLHIIDSGTQEVLKIDIFFKAGNWYQDKPLISSITNSMLTEGTKNLTSRQISEKFDFYGAYIQNTTEFDNSKISLITLNKFLPETLDIVNDILTNSIFPKKELSILLKNKKQQYITESKKTKNVAKKEFLINLFGKDHPYSNYFELGDFDKVSQKELIDYYNKQYESNNCWIIASGKIPGNFVNQMNQYLGSLQSSNNNIQNLSFEVVDSKNKKVFVEKEDAVQSSIRIGKVLFKKNHPDFIGMQVLSTILGGYFGSRLMTNIREEKGYTYGIGSVLMSLQHEGYLAILTDVGADVRKDAIKEIYKEINILQIELVPEEELIRVKNYLLGSMLKDFDGPFSLSDMYESILSYGFGPEYFSKMISKIKTITSEEIFKLANQYLDINTLHEVVAGK